MNWIRVSAILLANSLAVTIFDRSWCHATPLTPQGPPMPINPFIYHWEPAKFDRSILDVAHERHALHRRRKRSINYNHHSADYGPANEIRLNFFAHDREFRLVLKEDPSSVFAADLEILSSNGPLDFDASRIYTGHLEDDENSYVHGILTQDNLFDGTISTQTDHYYIEPSSKYSAELGSRRGIHTVIYRLSDVRMQQLEKNGGSHHHHCASERLHAKLKNDMGLEGSGGAPSSSDTVVISNKHKDKSDIYNYYKVLLGDNRIKLNRKRKKRWLTDELLEARNPSPPLDLEIPFNDDLGSILTRSRDEPALSDDARSPSRGGGNNSRKNILINTYNPISDPNLRNSILLKNNRNIIVNTYDSANSNYEGNSVNATTNNTTSRPSHKTHVEIITKNGATKKPNIIVNSYDPDVIITGSINNGDNTNNFNLNVRNDLSSNGDPATASAADRKSTCMLYLQADHTFSEKMGSDEASIEAITRHVQRANVIYKNTDFNGDGKPDNITFMIKRIKVHNKNALKDPTYRFSGNYGVEKFLELFSEEDYDAFCLAYMFTYRDFEMGTLGLAWTGDLKNAGGVCEKNGHYRGSLKSLNTGIVTLLNYGKHVPPAVSHVTLAHEIGHNFGSPHDPEQCTPGGEDGNYIMFARATSGDKRNNNKFSSCSLRAIEPVLNAKARSAKGCFTEPQQSICGNGVVEPGEECDCGWEEDCKDTCCYPMSRHPRKGEKPCTLTPRAKCSPSQGPCCTTECSLKFGDKCRDDNGCRDPSYCDGNMPQCPPSVNKPNKTICNNEFVCFMGECTGSICLAYGLESCQCIAGPTDNKTKACDLCCKEPGEGKVCKSSRDWNEPPFDVPDMFAKAGTPCNDYNGYCDVFHICREVDPSGPLATLRKLLLSEESIASFRKLLYHYWYLAILILVSIFVASVLAMKYFGKRTNLKLKNVTIIHSTTAEAIRLFEENNGMIVHTAVRKKVPLKKKVRSKQSSKSHKAPQSSSTLKDPLSSSKPVPIQTVVTQNGNSATVAPALPSKRPLKEKKLTKKKPPKTADEKSPLSEGPEKPAKPPKSKKKLPKPAKIKEIIDYSGRSELHTNTFGKVQRWLMDNPLVTSSVGVAQPTPEINHTAHVKNITKSVSTPEKLTLRSPKKALAIPIQKVKTKSVGNLNEKVKLQVVYKPPFKFSLKLSKNESVKTQAVGGRSKRKARPGGDKKRVGAEPPRRRSAILVRGTSEEAEPTYETLTPKKELPSYENLLLQQTSPINTATFRISKSATSGNVPGGTPSVAQKPSSISLSKKNSVNSLNQVVTSHPNGRRSSLTPFMAPTNLTKHYGGSSHNLMRSSTTNLTKGGPPLSRSSTTNLTKDYHRHGSHANLRRGSTDDLRGRKNSTSSRHGNSNLRYSSSGNIHRPQGKVSRPVHPQRPHTSGCEEKHFVWPLRTKEEPLPSDMEVMVSDVENVLQER